MHESDRSRRMNALEGIDAILWDTDRDLPLAAISLKTLFEREQMDVHQINEDRLFQIASKMLPILKAFEERNLFPGLYDLADWYVLFSDDSCEVFLTHPERFQFEDSEQDYEWYPEDERLFGENTIFDREQQIMANDRLLYKVLIASTKGNVKIPPVATNLDYSQDFYIHLAKPFLEHFESRQPWTLAQWEKAITERSAGSRLHKHDISQKSEEEDPIQTVQCNYRLYVLLRSDFENSFTMSRMLYEQMDWDETEQNRRGSRDQIAFVYGDRSIQLREWASYTEHFRIQLENKIRPYRASEALLIACDYMEELQSELAKTSAGKASISSICNMIILVEHRLSNDRLFQIALNRLADLREQGLNITVRKTPDSDGEAVWRLEHVCK